MDEDKLQEFITCHGTKGWKRLCEHLGHQTLQDELGEDRLLPEILQALRESKHTAPEISRFKRRYQEDNYARTIFLQPHLFPLQEEITSKILKRKSLELIQSPVPLPIPQCSTNEHTTPLVA